MNIETYQTILNSVKHPIVFVDNDHIIRCMNRAAKVQDLGTLYRIPEKGNRINFQEESTGN